MYHVPLGDLTDRNVLAPYRVSQTGEYRLGNKKGLAPGRHLGTVAGKHVVKVKAAVLLSRHDFFKLVGGGNVVAPVGPRVPIVVDGNADPVDIVVARIVRSYR